jgi:hypothetical protein
MLQLVVDLAQRQQALPEFVLQDLRELFECLLEGRQLPAGELKLAAWAAVEARLSHGF